MLHTLHIFAIIITVYSKRRKAMDFNLNLPINVISGENAVAKSSGLLRGLGKSCVIVTGGSSARLSGALEDMTGVLEKEGIGYTVYDKIGPNPRLDLCFEAGALAREVKADFIAGIGGGSPLDAAKAVAVYASNPQLSMDEIYTTAERNKALPLVLIGTTSGTGSEVGRVSVLTHPVTNRKKSISPVDCFPTLTLADPKYTHSMPYDITVSTALDAMAHALEGYMGVKCTDIPTLFGEKAVELIWKGLCFLYENKKEKALPDAKLREALYYGSLYAGITLAYCGTAFPHPMGYILTENYGVPHGKACTAFMDSFIDRAAVHTPERLERALGIMKTDKNTFKRIINELTDLKGITMTRDEIENYCTRFDTAPSNFKFSPGGYTKEDALEELTKKFGG
ncbi:MAG: iron-containing alcohol dehydrogenase [Ruminococcaceae bacterium]|nr:iron-containing alcohol dehydrogenase [Oscillospiraceae bacterium]